MDARQLSALSQAFENTCGSSDGNTSVKHKYQGDNLIVTYTSVVHFAEEYSLREQTKRETERSVMMINDCISKVKTAYKELYGSALKIKEISSNDNIEIVSASAMSPRKIAYYRRYVTYEVR
jgi:hypothetical protein